MPDREEGGSPAYGRQRRHSRVEDWRSRSPGQYYSRSPRHRSSRSPRRNRSWSPAPRRGDHHKKRGRHASDKSKWGASPEDSCRGEYCILIHTLGTCRNARTISVKYKSCLCGLIEAPAGCDNTDGHGYRRPSSKEKRNRRRQSATSSGSESSHRRDHEKSSRHHRKGDGRSPPRSNSQSPHDRYARHPSDDARQRGSRSFVKLEEIPETSPAFERRQRRYKQAAREADSARRSKDGKKPFYITLDKEGIPYGTGKPAWMAEINKLAMGLDPSCTHIKKQTYEDVSIFKERLNQSFEYSGELNEEHLRGLMGKAVTKKRTELISLIKKGGSQPKHIDAEVWERLQKLAASRQWEEKSLQGRYANACRKTINRTGNRGVNGVRENLREILGRSPDPDEVYTEAHRDKGTRVKKEMDKVSTKWDISAEEGTSEEDGEEESMENSIQGGASYEGVGHKSQVTTIPIGDEVYSIGYVSLISEVCGQTCTMCAQCSVHYCSYPSWRVVNLSGYDVPEVTFYASLC